MDPFKNARATFMFKPEDHTPEQVEQIQKIIAEWAKSKGQKVTPMIYDPETKEVMTPEEYAKRESK